MVAREIGVGEQLLGRYITLSWGKTDAVYALEALRRCTRRCVVSTRIARYAGRPRTSLEKLPVAYLLEEREANNDPTNYWIFSETGLLRLFARTGWVVSDFLTVGDTSDSDPAVRNTTSGRFAC